MRFMVKTAITAWREHFGLSKAELIRRCRLAKTTVYSAEDDGLASPATLIAIANALNISVSELLSGPPEYEGKPRSPAVRTIPLYVGVPMAGWERTSNRHELQVLETQIEDPATIAVIVEGDAMYPTLLDGDVVLVNPTLTSHEHGHIVCAVDTKNERGFIGRYRCSGSLHGLVFDNPLYRGVGPDEMEGVEIIGRVVRLQGRDLARDGFWPSPPHELPKQH